MKVPLEHLPGGFDFPIWPELDTPITREEVQEAVTCGRYVDSPAMIWPERLTDGSTINLPPREVHIRRVAYFVTHGWSDPIVLNAQPGYWPVLDGNHRLTAAHFRGDMTIEAEFDGFEDDIAELFGPEIAALAVKDWDSV
jgi:hypothetical protein